MKVVVVAVGRARGLFADPIGEYERRIERYFGYATVEVREEPSRKPGDIDRVRTEEGGRLLARVPTGFERVALHRGGRSWSSERFAEYLGQLGVQASPGVAFLIGGAFGLPDELLRGVHHTVSLSACTLPHELARLVLVEQIYRAGTILRGEPYHKGPAGAVPGSIGR